MKLFQFLLILLVSYPACSQEAVKPRPSPIGVVTAHYKDSYLKIVYSQPSKRGREVFGTLVPFGQVWRTGANEATEMTLTRDLKINGAELKAGTYSVFTIPGRDTWTIIINSDLGLWGAYNYNTKSDILRFEVPVAMLTDIFYESFTMSIDQKNDKAEWQMAWDQSKVIIPIQFLEPKL